MNLLFMSPKHSRIELEIILTILDEIVDQFGAMIEMLIMQYIIYFMLLSFYQEHDKI